MHSFPIPNNQVTFTELVCDILSREDSSFDKWGRNGQEQFGFDIYSVLKGVVVECKWKAGNRNLSVSYKELRDDITDHVSRVNEFKGFKVSRLIIATTLPEDTGVQQFAVELSQGAVNVEVWGWGRLERSLNSYPILIKKYFPQYYYEELHKRNFKSHRSISENHFSSSQGNVFLNAHLPWLMNQGKGSCLISLKANRDFMISLNSADIMDLQDNRKMSIEDNICHGQVNQADNLWFVSIRSASFYIDDDTKKELCYMLDDFLNEYGKAFANYKKALGAERFELTRSGSYVKMLSVSKGLWEKMMRFSHEFDFDEGKSEWHIFNKNVSSIIVQEESSINAWLSVERSKPVLYDILRDSDSVDVLWQVPAYTEMSKPGMWNAEKTYWWLKESFIPKVTAHYDKQRRKGLFKSLGLARFGT